MVDKTIAWGRHGRIGSAWFWGRVAAMVVCLEAFAGKRGLACFDIPSEFAMAVMAAGHLRCTIVLASSEQAKILLDQDADLDFVMTDQPQDFVARTCVRVPEEPIAGVTRALAIDDAARIEFHTSGSSGQPSNISVAYGDLRAEIAASSWQWRDLAPATLVVATVPFYHRYGFNMLILWPLATGRPFYDGLCAQPGDMAKIPQDVAHIIISSPSFLRMLGDERYALPSTRVAAIFSAGAPLSREVALRVKRIIKGHMIDIYGSTEAGVIGYRQWRPDSDEVWTAFAKVKSRINEDGSLHVWLPYTGQWLAVGDVAKAQVDRRFELLGRVDNVVKIADKRVSLDNMVRHLGQHPCVEDVRVLLLGQERKYLGAAVVLTPAGRNFLQHNPRLALIDSLRACLFSAAYEGVLMPRRWRFLDAWPQDAMGKVRRAWLLQLFAESQHA